MSVAGPDCVETLGVGITRQAVQNQLAKVYRIVGRVTASQIASASAASFLLVLTKGRTY